MMLADDVDRRHYTPSPPTPTPTICSSDRQQLSMSYVLLLQVSTFTDIRELLIHTQRGINLADGKKR